jgi:hypothetical protein
MLFVGCALIAPAFAADDPQFVIDAPSQVLQPPPADKARGASLEKSSNRRVDADPAFALMMALGA